jgi:molybdate transport system substrate-binding protein
LRNLLKFLLVGSLLLSGCHHPTPDTKQQITVAAAADLGPAFEELGRLFEQQSGIEVVFSFGSTGTLAQQIANGAPMDLFAAANVAYVDGLEQQGLIIPDTKALYARGRITLWTNKDSTLKLAEITDLTRPEVKRIAIANPDHAPYGLAAKQALESAGVWDAVKPKLVYGDNIRQTLQFAQTGNADVAIVALSLSIVSDGHWILVPAELHEPLDQALAVIKGTQHEGQARQFASFINSPPGRAIMDKYGFTLPQKPPQ